MFTNRIVRRSQVSLLGTSLILLLLLGACGGGTPQDISFDLSIVGGALTGDDTTFVAKQDDTVTLNLTADAHGEVHLHGYDLTQNVGPDEPSSINFVADATGRFSIEFHSAGVSDGHDDHAHGDVDSTLGALEVRPR